MVVDLPDLMKVFIGLVRDMGLPMPSIEVGGEPCALAGGAIYLEPAAIRSELLLPAAPVKSLWRAAEKLNGAAE